MNNDFDRTRAANSARLSNLLRYGIVALLILVGAPSALAIGAIIELTHAGIMAVIVLSYTTLGYLYIKNYQEILTVNRIVFISFLQILADVFVFTYLIHITGGITSVFTFFYGVPILIAGIMFTRYAWMAFSVAATVNLLYDGLLYLEYFKLLPFSPGIPWVHEVYAGPVLVVTFSLLVPLSFWGVMLFAFLGSRQYTKTRDEIEQGLKVEVASLSARLEKKLEETNAELYQRNKELETSLVDRERMGKESIKHMEEVEKMNKFMVGREMEILELKKEINRLLKVAGQPEKYRV